MKRWIKNKNNTDVPSYVNCDFAMREAKNDPSHL